ncbi:hypothetical protein ES703_12903 [subsurface metagenome]
MLKKQITTILLFLVAIFIYQWFMTRQFHWSIIGVAVLSALIVYLTSKRDILKLIGEYPHPKRTKRIYGLTWGLAIVLSVPFVFYLLDQFIKQEPDFKDFAIFIIIPILFGLAIEMTKIPNITNKTQSGLICVIKKLALSTVLFIIFIPFFILTNKLHIDINSTPDFIRIESLFRGFVVWSMVFCFYAGLFLFNFSIVDLIIVIKDLSTRKARKA